MSIKTIQQLIKGEYIYEGRAVTVPVKSVYIGTDVVDNAMDLLEECGLCGKALVVSDVNTHAVLGAKIEAVLGINSQPNAVGASLVLQKGAKADVVNVEKIKKSAKSVDYIIAVGGGTINDLCKYASFLLDKPYVIFGTAPSMNGYGSANASITISDHKKTVKAHLPQGIFLDINVLSAAPVRLIRSGLGDSVCRSTAQADWLLSHLLLGTPYTALPFELLKEPCGQGGSADDVRNLEQSLFSNSKDLVKGDAEIVRLLAETLVVSGFGMYIAGGSYPASQGEHMIAHTMEMAYGNSIPHSHHGEQIGVTTLTMARLQERILGKLVLQLPLLPLHGGGMEGLGAILGDEVASECQSEYKAKQFTKVQIADINERLSGGWGSIKERIYGVILPYDEIYNALVNAGCPVTPGDMGWKVGQYNNAVQFAKFTRDRYTFLDL